MMELHMSGRQVEKPVVKKEKVALAIAQKVLCNCLIQVLDVLPLPWVLWVTHNFVFSVVPCCKGHFPSCDEQWVSQRALDCFHLVAIRTSHSIPGHPPIVSRHGLARIGPNQWELKVEKYKQMKVIKKKQCVGPQAKTSDN
jgi:hypothetical protein